MTYVFEPPGIFTFFTWPLQILDKTASSLETSQNSDTSSEILRPKSRPLENF